MSKPRSDAAAIDAGRPHGHARGVAWAVLVGTAGTELVYNIVHATGHLQVLLAVLYGVAPVATAIGLSHIVAACRGGWLMRTITVVVMLGAMALSVDAVAMVVAPAAGVLRYLFPAVLDGAAMLALQVVLSPRQAQPGEGGAAEAGPAPGATKGATVGATMPATNVPAAPAPPVVAGEATTMLARPATATPGADGPAITTGRPSGPDPAAAAAAGTPAAGARTAQPGWEGGDWAPPVDRGQAPAPGAPQPQGNRPGNISEARGRRGETRKVMRDFWDQEIATGNMPSGADLNRAADKDPGYSLGKKYAAEWREEVPAAVAAAGLAGGGAR